MITISAVYRTDACHQATMPFGTAWLEAVLMWSADCREALKYCIDKLKDVDRPGGAFSCLGAN